VATAALIRMTLADGLRQPLTWLATGLSVALVALSFGFGMFNFELTDRLRMLSTAGVAIGVLNGLFLAVVGASTAIHAELADRTALTLFAKPVSRGSFLVGKCCGLWLTVVAATLPIIAVHFAALAIGQRSGFEFGHSHGHADDDTAWIPWIPLLAAHGLGLAHSAILVCIAAVLALRLGLVANILISFAVFVLGHLLAVGSAAGTLVMPVLALFNIDDTILFRDQSLSWTYCISAALYAALHCAGCLFLGLALFKRQDLA